MRARGAVVRDDVMAVDRHGARGRLDDAADDADQRGLAGAVRAEQREDLAAADVEIDVLERLEARTHRSWRDSRRKWLISCGGLLELAMAGATFVSLRRMAGGMCRPAGDSRYRAGAPGPARFHFAESML